MLNLTYTIKGDDPHNIEEPFILAVSHDFETADIMLMCNETRTFKNKTNIVARKDKNITLNQFWKDFPLFTHYNKIDIGEERGTKSSQSLIDKLKKGENVLLFLGRNKERKGIYYLVKETDVPILYVKIYKKNGKKPDKNRNQITNLYGEEFIVEYKFEKNHPIEKEPQDFVKYVESNLYSE